MQQRRTASVSAHGRPSGTDGSDFSYRMVVDSRYTKVAQGKSRLYALLLFQALIQLTRVLCTFLSKLKYEDFDAFAISSPALGFFSLILGEIGRRRSRVTFLKIYMAGSTIAILLWIPLIAKHYFLFKGIHNSGEWQAKLEILEIGQIISGFLVQILAISTTISLIHNMRPPKNAS